MKLEKYLTQEQLNKILQENFKKLLTIINRIEEIEHDLIELRIKSNKFPGYKVEVDNPIKYKIEYEIAINELKNLYEMGENILIILYDNVDKGIACEMLSNIIYRSRIKNMLQLLDN